MLLTHVIRLIADVSAFQSIQNQTPTAMPAFHASGAHTFVRSLRVSFEYAFKMTVEVVGNDGSF
jgi:hypothetical protein